MLTEVFFGIVITLVKTFHTLFVMTLFIMLCIYCILTVHWKQVASRKIPQLDRVESRWLDTLEHTRMRKSSKQVPPLKGCNSAGHVCWI